MIVLTLDTSLQRTQLLRPHKVTILHQLSQITHLKPSDSPTFTITLLLEVESLGEWGRLVLIIKMDQLRDRTSKTQSSPEQA